MLSVVHTFYAQTFERRSATDWQEHPGLTQSMPACMQAEDGDAQAPLSEPSTSLAGLGGEQDGYRLAARDGPAEPLLCAELLQLVHGARWWEKDGDWLQVPHAVPHALPSLSALFVAAESPSMYSSSSSSQSSCRMRLLEVLRPAL